MEQLACATRPLLRLHLCASCRRAWTIGGTPQRIGLQNSERIQRRSKGYIAPAGGQARPLEGFYAELLSKSLSETTPATRTAPEQPPPQSTPKTENEELLARARVVFGSRLPEPEKRREEINAASQVVAGILVPPRPKEPDNCCMSGCVNCVWDMYRDEMEEWAAKSAEARTRIQIQREEGRGTGSMLAAKDAPTHTATSMDDDGGGSDSNWTSAAGPGDLFDDIPVGIRAFMMMEKKLKEKHKATQAA